MDERPARGRISREWPREELSVLSSSATRVLVAMRSPGEAGLYSASTLKFTRFDSLTGSRRSPGPPVDSALSPEMRGETKRRECSRFLTRSTALSRGPSTFKCRVMRPSLPRTGSREVTCTPPGRTVSRSSMASVHEKVLSSKSLLRSVTWCSNSALAGWRIRSW